MDRSCSKTRSLVGSIPALNCHSFFAMPRKRGSWVPRAPRALRRRALGLAPVRRPQFVVPHRNVYYHQNREFHRDLSEALRDYREHGRGIPLSRLVLNRKTRPYYKLKMSGVMPFSRKFNKYAVKYYSLSH